jgi:tartrate dehydrogenase/decarboxylase/D-malate dehydrogenase
VCGTIRIASANINPERDSPSLFRPVRGSAPDIAGQGVANPISQMVRIADARAPGTSDAAAAVVRAIETVLTDPKASRTRDMGGTATTVELGKAIAAAI